MDINDAIIVLRARMKSLIRKIDAPEREALQTAIRVMEMCKWHPYPDEKPNKECEYLCVLTWKDVVINLICRWTEDVYSFSRDDFPDIKGKKVSAFLDYDGWNGCWSITVPTAWMPLPEPYKDGEQE